MKRIYKWLDSIFAPKVLQNLDMMEVLDCMNDPVIRKLWLYSVFEELQRLNLEVDRRLLNGGFRIEDLCAKRQAYQSILETIFSAKRTVKSMGLNPTSKSGEFDLDSVTVKTSPY